MTDQAHERLELFRDQKAKHNYARCYALWVLQQSSIWSALEQALRRKIVEILHPHNTCAVFSVQFIRENTFSGYERSKQFTTSKEARIYMNLFMPIEKTNYFEINIEVFVSEEQILDGSGEDFLECVQQEDHDEEVEN